MLFRLLFFLVITSGVFAQKNKELIIATYQYADNPRIENIQPFADALAGELKKQTRVKSFPTVGELIQAMHKGEVDIVFINTFGYLLYSEKGKGFSIAANLALPSAQASTYQSMIVSSVKSPVKKMEDISRHAHNLSVLFVNPGSTSGNLIPRLKFAELGLSSDSDFKSVTYTKNHAATLQQIAAGVADIGAFGNEEYQKAIALDSGIRHRVHVLWESAPIPLGPVMFSKGLLKEDSTILLQTLLELDAKHPSALQSIKDGWTEAKHATRFQVADDEFYLNNMNLKSPDAMAIIRKFAQ